MKKPSNPLSDVLKNLNAEKEIELPMDPAYYDRLHDRIMAGIEQTEIKPPAWYERPSRLLRAHWRSWAAAGGSLSGLLLFTYLGAQTVAGLFQASNTVVAARHEDQILEEALHSPETLSRSILVSQSSTDFFVDVAEGSIENLSVDKFNRVMGRDLN